MTPTPTGRRAGFTLVELLVVMGVIIILSSIALLVVPSVLTQDRTTDAAGRLQQWLTLSKLRAARDGLPRGVRLLDNGSGLVTECQYIETPAPVLRNFRIAINYGRQTETVSGTPTSVPLQENIGGDATSGSFGIFVIADPGAGTPADAGFLPPDYVQRGAYIPVLELDMSLRIQQALPANRDSPGMGASGPNPDTFVAPPGIGTLLRGNEKLVWKLVLSTTPGITPGSPAGAPPGFDKSGPYTRANNYDSPPKPWNAFAPASGPYLLAAAPVAYSTGSGPTTSATYPDVGTGVQVTPPGNGVVKIVEGPFLVYPPPDPLLGEPVLQLASDTVIDLNLSRNGTTTGLTAPVDLVFNPTGELTTLSGLAPGGQVFLWVRNKKGTGSSASMADFETSGEQQLVGIKSRTGGMGVYPVAWDTTNPYKFGMTALGQ